MAAAARGRRKHRAAGDGFPLAQVAPVTDERPYRADGSAGHISKSDRRIGFDERVGRADQLVRQAGTTNSGSLLALGATLEAGALQHFLVLLLAHALAALLDQRSHEASNRSGLEVDAANTCRSTADPPPIRRRSSHDLPGPSATVLGPVKSGLAPAVRPFQSGNLVPITSRSPPEVASEQHRGCDQTHEHSPWTTARNGVPVSAESGPVGVLRVGSCSFAGARR